MKEEQPNNHDRALNLIIESSKQALERAVNMEEIAAMDYLLTAVDQIDEATGRIIPGQVSDLTIEVMAETMTGTPGPYTELRDIRRKIRMETDRLQRVIISKMETSENDPMTIICRKISSIADYQGAIEDIERDINILIEKGWITAGGQLPLDIHGNTEKDRIIRSLQIYFHWKNLNPEKINRPGKKRIDYAKHIKKIFNITMPENKIRDIKDKHISNTDIQDLAESLNE